MKSLILCRFDPVRGAVIFLKTPNSMSQEELEKIPTLMSIPSEGFFIHTFETFKTANFFIKLPSSNARGRLEKFLISIIIEGNSALDLSIGKQFLVNFAHDFINVEDAYKGLDIESKGYKGDVEIFNQIKNLFNSFFKTIKPAIDALEISEYNLKERVKELTCLYGLSELLDDPNNFVEDILQKTLKLIPPAWQYPENTCTRIIYNDKEYKTEGYSDTPWTQMIVKEISGNVLTIQVNSFEDKTFHKEEEALINDIGNRLKMRLEQKEAEQNLKESEELLLNILENSSNVIYRFNYEKNSYDYVSPSSAYVLGYPPDEMKSMGIKRASSLIHIKDRRVVMNHFEKIMNFELKDEINPIIEFRFKHKDGNYIWINDTRTAIHNEKHEPIAFIGNIQDISKRKRAEQELKEKLIQF